MGGETVHHIWSSYLDLEAKVAFLQGEAQQRGAHLQEDAARYVAQNLQSNVRELRVALNPLIAYSTLTGNPITLNWTKRILGKFLESRGAESTVDPFQGIFSGPYDRQQSTSPEPSPMAMDCSVVFSLVKTREGQKITQVRKQFEVNMREFEREQLAHLDVYERALEIRVKKQRRR